MKKVALVTGGAGYVGSHLTDALLEKNYKVIAYDDLRIGSKKNLKKASGNPNFEFIKADIRNKKTLEKAIKRSSIIYHLAAVVGVTEVVKRPLENISVNIEGTRIVAEAAFKHGKKKVVFTSSSEVYGKNSKVPLKENISDSVFGSTKVTRWGYGMAKALGEQILWEYNSKGLPVAVVRYFNCYGPRGINKAYANVAPKFIIQALKDEPITVYGKGIETRSFTYVDDTVRGTILAGEKLNGDVLNIGSSRETKIVDLAKKVIKLTGSKSKIKFIPKKVAFDREFEDTKARLPSTSKAKKLINFQSKINLETGLEKTIEWTRKELF